MLSQLVYLSFGLLGLPRSSASAPAAAWTAPRGPSRRHGTATGPRHPVEPAPDAAARAVHLALRDAGLVPSDDPRCALDVVAGRPRRVALSKAFGFGGHNSAVVLIAP